MKIRFETREDAVPSEMHTVSSCPVLEALGFRVQGFRVVLDLGV